MRRTREAHGRQDERAGTAEEPSPEEDGGRAREPDAEADTEDDESLRRRDAWWTEEHDRHAKEVARIDEAARPLGRIEIDPDEVIDARAMCELGRTSQLEPVQIDSRVERMDEEDRIPESEYGLLVETKVRIVDGKLAEQEATTMLSAGWLAVQRNQIEAVAEAIEKTGMSSAQAIAITMMIVAAQIGEYRMRDLIESMAQGTEVPTNRRETR